MSFLVSQKTLELAKEFGYLENTVNRFVTFFGLSETRKMLEAYEKTPSQSIRVNTLKISTKELEEKLAKKQFEYTISSWYENGLIISKEPYSLGGTTEYLSGICDASSTKLTGRAIRSYYI